MPSIRTAATALTLGAAVVATASVALVAPTAAQAKAAPTGDFAVTVNGILQHERAFQSIANANGGTRASARRREDTVSCQQ